MTKECLDPELMSDILHAISIVCSHIMKLGEHGNNITTVRVSHSVTCMEMNVNLSEFLSNQCSASCPDLINNSFSVTDIFFISFLGFTWHLIQKRTLR